jgi:hypothetical protein
MKTKGQGFVVGVILFLILIVGMFELGLLVYAYLHADEVKCNLLWCEFTTTRQYSSTVITTNSSCYYSVNGIEINCSEANVEDSPFWTKIGQYYTGEDK